MFAGVVWFGVAMRHQAVPGMGLDVVYVVGRQERQEDQTDGHDERHGSAGTGHRCIMTGTEPSVYFLLCVPT